MYDPTKNLMDFLKPLLRLKQVEVDMLENLLEEYVNNLAEKKASDALDREFNRGDWRQ